MERCLSMTFFCEFLITEFVDDVNTQVCGKYMYICKISEPDDYINTQVFVAGSHGIQLNPEKLNIVYLWSLT